MVEMGCEEHDRQAASTQFITHTVGRMLGEMKVSEGVRAGTGVCAVPRVCRQLLRRV